MKSETSIVARQYRLQEWADLVRDCNNRPDKMTIKQWCDHHSISTANYYYRLTEVRKACLESNHISFNQNVVPVPATLLSDVSDSSQTAEIELSVNEICIRLTKNTSAELLKMVLEVASHVK